MAAAKRGVDVQLFLPQHNDEPLEQHAERYVYSRMIEAGVRVFEYHGRPRAHDKVATFDGQVSTIGSSNLDARSLHNNDEANVWSSAPEVAQKLDRDLFGKDVHSSTAIREWRPTLFERAVDFVSWKLSPLL